MRRKKKKKQAKQARLHNFCIQEYIRGKVMQPQLHRCKTCVAVIFPCQDYFQHQQVWRDQTPKLECSSLNGRGNCMCVHSFTCRKIAVHANFHRVLDEPLVLVWNKLVLGL